MKHLVLLTAITLLAACDAEIMDTSGQAYLAKGNAADQDTARAAAYEPTLSFPARVGVVRLVYSRITTMPTSERAILSADLPEGIGTLTHLGALEAELIGRHYANAPDQANLRQLAASRHLDYLLVLKFDPTENTAEALFVDVRSGYPYASLDVNGEGAGIRNFWGNRPRNSDRINRKTLGLAKRLKPSLDQAVRRLLATARQT